MENFRLLLNSEDIPPVFRDNIWKLIGWSLNSFWKVSIEINLICCLMMTLHHRNWNSRIFQIENHSAKWRFQASSVFKISITLSNCFFSRRITTILEMISKLKNIHFDVFNFEQTPSNKWRNQREKFVYLLKISSLRCCLVFHSVWRRLCENK